MYRKTALVTYEDKRQLEFTGISLLPFHKCLGPTLSMSDVSRSECLEVTRLLKGDYATQVGDGPSESSAAGTLTHLIRQTAVLTRSLTKANPFPFKPGDLFTWP